MAGILSIFGEPNFWEFNVMELFASIAIILGVIWTIRKYRGENSRRNKLISFPDTWIATRRLDKGIFEVKADVDVFLKHYACRCDIHAQIDGKPIIWESEDLSEPQEGREKGRWSDIAKASLSSISPDAKEVEVWLEILLDGEIPKKSKKRQVAISDKGVARSIPDKKGSLTE